MPKRLSERHLSCSGQAGVRQGRRGRSWVSPSGTGIFMTLMIKPDINPNNASMLTLVAALAVAKAITSVTGEEAMIKWPNDIVVNGKRCAAYSQR